MTTAQGLRKGRIPQLDTSDLYTRMWLARQTAGLSLQELADALRIKRTTLTNYETGVTPPTDDLLRAWASACEGTDSEWLIGDYVKPARKPRGRLSTHPYVPSYMKLLPGGAQKTAPLRDHLWLVSQSV